MAHARGSWRAALGRLARRCAAHVPTAGRGAWPEDDLALAARDVGVSATTLRALAAKDSHAADLLPRRLESLRIEPDGISPPLLREMEAACSFCESKTQCSRELGETDPPWPGYCPNSASLSALIAELPAR